MDKEDKRTVLHPLNSCDTVDHLYNHHDPHTPQHHDMPRVLCFILGGGSFSATGSCFVDKRTDSDCGASIRTEASTPPCSPNPQQVVERRQQFLRHSSSFLRVADLNLHLDDEHLDHAAAATTAAATTATYDDASSITCSECGDTIANFSYAAVDPPPGMDHDPEERWIALDDGAGRHAPIAPRAVAALAKVGFEAALDERMWTPHTAARHFRTASWHATTWPNSDGSSRSIYRDDLPTANSKQEEMVLLWTGKFAHGGYGSELPAVRAVGIVPAPPKDLFDLLIDSDRVKEYNKLSLGREDLLVLQDDLLEDGPFGSSVVTKVMRSKTSPPLISKTMELVSMLHAQELDDSSGYFIVTRAVTHPDEQNGSGGSVLRSEILLGVNIIKRVEGDPDRCIMINMIHMRSPMVPMMIANRIGATAADNFIRDLRAAFASNSVI